MRGKTNVELEILIEIYNDQYVRSVLSDSAGTSKGRRKRRRRREINQSFLFLFLPIHPLCRYRQTRFSSRRVRKRVVFKHGDCNVIQGNVAKRRRRYLQVNQQFFLFRIQFKLSKLGFCFFFLLLCGTQLIGHFYDAGRCTMALDDIGVCDEFHWHMVGVRGHLVAHCVFTRRSGFRTWQIDKRLR